MKEVRLPADIWMKLSQGWDASVRTCDGDENFRAFKLPHVSSDPEHLLSDVVLAFLEPRKVLDLLVVADGPNAIASLFALAKDTLELLWG